jgi:hypothetical protein
MPDDAFGVGPGYQIPDALLVPFGQQPRPRTAMYTAVAMILGPAPYGDGS